jgi:phosphotriesterase-related protein
VVIGHSGDTADLEYLEQLLERGSYLGMDRFGLYGILSFEERVRTVVELCERGHVERLVLSHDAACYNDWLPEGGVQFGWHHCHISQDVLPALRAAGLGDAELTCMLVDNPRRLFEVQGAY